jgi:hypothetical protein
MECQAPGGERQMGRQVAARLLCQQRRALPAAAHMVGTQGHSSALPSLSRACLERCMALSWYNGAVLQRWSCVALALPVLHGQWWWQHCV